jgi:tRNA (guanine-N7-)-methyltransferase
LLRVVGGAWDLPPFAMSKSKLDKFAELEELPNVYQNWSYLEPRLYGAGRQQAGLKGRWNAEHFGVEKPITLELACGRGEYTVGLARRYPERHFIGVDIKGNRIYEGARQAYEARLANAAFLRTDITLLEHFIGPGEIGAIWITFPDPYLKACKARKRLTAPRFLDIYRRIGVPGMPVHLKTDSQELYAFTLETLEQEGLVPELASPDIDSQPVPVDELAIPTYYERMHRDLGKPITYLQFRLF